MQKMIVFAGCKVKKIYITTFGGLNIYQYNDREKPVKMRSKKERELFAFLLDARMIRMQALRGAIALLSSLKNGGRILQNGQKFDIMQIKI